jgi:phospholipid-transporting ATPase
MVVAIPIYPIGEVIEKFGANYAINFNNFLLRGCNLRNVRCIYGLVAYTGHDTKIMLNSFKARSKKSKLEM